MEALTIYRVKGKDIGLEFLFKYDLKGNLKAFEIAEGELNDEQQLWLFNVIRFPSNESKINYWKENKKYSDKFSVEKAPPIITFDMVWELFGNKIKKFEAQERWKKTTEAQRIKIVTSIPGYKKYIDRKGVSQTNLATFIHKRYYEDDWNKA